MKKKNQEKMKKKIRKISSDLRIAGMQFMKNMIKLGRTEPPQFSMASCDHSYSRWIYRNSSDISSFERFTGKQKRIKPVKFEAGCWLFSVFVFFCLLSQSSKQCVCVFFSVLFIVIRTCINALYAIQNQKFSACLSSSLISDHSTRTQNH